MLPRILTGSGPNNREHVEAMIDKYPTWNSYWEDKKPQLHKINVPMYALASYSTGLHTVGSLRGFFLSSTQEKWYVAVYEALQLS